VNKLAQALPSQRDLEFLSAVGAQIAMPIERKRGERELEHAPGFHVA